MKMYPDQFTPWQPDKTAPMTISAAERRDLGISKGAALATVAAMSDVWRNGALQQLLHIVNGGGKDVPHNH